MYSLNTHRPLEKLFLLHDYPKIQKQNLPCINNIDHMIDVLSEIQ